MRNLKLKRSSQEKERICHQDLFTQYLSNIDDSVICESRDENEITHCKFCQKALMMNPVNGILGCPDCGYSEDILIFSEKGSYNDPPKEA